MRGIVVDLFAGGGGASVGLAAAIGREPDIAINHDPIALAVHRENHPQTRHLESDIWEVRPREATGGRPVAVLWASPDCFPAGTMVLTREGYRPIEEISVGDEVLTHRGRWRAVTSTMQSVKPLVRLRGHGHPGLLVSAEHPFYARLRKRWWNNVRRAWEHSLESVDWVAAGDLERGYYWASPIEFPADTMPVLPGSRKMASTPEFMWLVGRYLADGWTRLTDTRAELVLTCGRHEVEPLRLMLSPWTPESGRAGEDELKWHERETGTAHQFSANHRGLVTWLREHFGHGAAEKRIPGWALGLPSNLRYALLEGYMSGDGCVVRTSGVSVAHATTVSKSLAFGIKALAASVGRTPTVYLRENQPNVIEGRKVNVRPAWSVRWRVETTADHAQTVREYGFEWAPVRERQDDVAEAAEVFNLSVEGDESYVVDGIVVHNCTHFSNAKGDVPRSQNIRSLAWSVVRWADQTRPRVIFLENVGEFRKWGPLGPDGRPCKARMGQTFRRWVRKLERLGYVVDYRVLDASEFGAPTRRRRLFVVARCDGMPITWPEPTHGPGRLPLRTAAECIDWSLPCPSIFGRKRPLSDKTLWRIAQGIRRFVLECASPFVVLVNHGRVEFRGQGINEPLSTVTAQRRSHALVAPTLVQTGYGERPGQAPRVPGLHKPLGTCVDGQKHALVSAYLAKHYGDPCRTDGAGGVVLGTQLDLPLGTVTARDHHSLAAVTLAKFRGTSDQHPGCCPVDEPLPTVTAGGTHVAEVRAFLTAYYSRDAGQALDEPARTFTAKHRLGLVTVEGTDYQITDIGLRMLQPHELLRAQFGRFADGYLLDAARTKAAKVRLIGNSVCPEVAEAVVRANLADVAERGAA